MVYPSIISKVSIGNKMIKRILTIIIKYYNIQKQKLKDIVKNYNYLLVDNSISNRDKII
jgi:hypothetical protein